MEYRRSWKALCGYGRSWAFEAFSASRSRWHTSLPVTSDMIEAVYFSQEDGKLRVRMHNGEERLFQGVNQDDAEALVKSPSPGRHYIEQIRTKFPRLAA